jgi:hypothetical protein
VISLPCVLLSTTTAPLGDKHVRVYREYEYQSIYTPPHEIVHALQTLISDSQVRGLSEQHWCS